MQGQSLKVLPCPHPQCLFFFFFFFKLLFFWSFYLAKPQSCTCFIHSFSNLNLAEDKYHTNTLMCLNFQFIITNLKWPLCCLEINQYFPAHSFSYSPCQLFLLTSLSLNLQYHLPHSLALVWIFLLNSHIWIFNCLQDISMYISGSTWYTRAVWKNIQP